MRLDHFSSVSSFLACFPLVSSHLKLNLTTIEKSTCTSFQRFPPPSAQLPVIGAPSDIGTESELLMVWRTQAFYWGYALESMGAELVMREGIFLFSLISMRRVLSGTLPR